MCMYVLFGDLRGWGSFRCFFIWNMFKVVNWMIFQVYVCMKHSKHGHVFYILEDVMPQDSKTTFQLCVNKEINIPLSLSFILSTFLPGIKVVVFLDLTLFRAENSCGVTSRNNSMTISPDLNGMAIYPNCDHDPRSSTTFGLGSGTKDITRQPYQF